ncbi:zinc finger protein 184-like isoform X2 [Mya arenaria]|uniref:zinc finger protein 184-like isoform X2 n=1 Tax=Mya arenaria TaxID=6604 RepID=UPI0022DFAA13|nr:zinc finger protein 184-like isoform X2 [Mya arenaria]
MGTYLIMLHVTLCQERALKQLFQDKGWPFLKPDLLSTTQTLGPMPVTNFHKTPNLPAAAAEAQKRQAETATNIQQPEIKRKRVAEPSVECEQGTAQETEVDHREEEDNLGELLSKTPLQETQEQGCIKLDGTDTAIGDTADAEDNVDEKCLTDESPTLIRTNKSMSLALSKPTATEWVKTVITSSADITQSKGGLTLTAGISQNSASLTSMAVAGQNVVKVDLTGLVTSECHMDEIDEALENSAGLEDEHFTGDVRLLIAYKCDACDDVFEALDHLKSHEEQVHGAAFPDTAEWVCGVCNDKVFSENYLKMHFKVVHDIDNLKEIEQKFKCEKCGKQLYSNKAYQGHMTHVHRGNGKAKKYTPLRDQEVRYFCPHCSHGFRHMTHMNDHIALKHDRSLLRCSCPLCPERFVRPWEVENHVNKVHFKKKDYVCTNCGKGSYSKVAFKKHQSMCLKSVDDQFHCDVCNQLFKTKQNMTMHKEALHSESPLTCECGVVIKWRSSMAKHRRKCSLASGNKPQIHIKRETKPDSTDETNCTEHSSKVEKSAKNGKAIKLPMKLTKKSEEQTNATNKKHIVTEKSVTYIDKEEAADSQANAREVFQVAQPDSTNVYYVVLQQQ